LSTQCFLAMYCPPNIQHLCHDQGDGLSTWDLPTPSVVSNPAWQLQFLSSSEVTQDLHWSMEATHCVAQKTFKLSGDYPGWPSHGPSPHFGELKVLCDQGNRLSHGYIAGCPLRTAWAGCSWSVKMMPATMDRACMRDMAGSDMGWMQEAHREWGCWALPRFLGGECQHEVVCCWCMSYKWLWSDEGGQLSEPWNCVIQDWLSNSTWRIIFWLGSFSCHRLYLPPGTSSP
jgi:hypothetical protein